MEGSTSTGTSNEGQGSANAYAESGGPIHSLPTGAALQSEELHSPHLEEGHQQRQDQHQHQQNQQQQQQQQQQQTPGRTQSAGTADRGHRYSLARRAQCLSLLAVGLSSREVEHHCGIPPRTQRNIWNKAKARGYDPKISPHILDSYIIDGERSGRPKASSSNSDSLPTEASASAASSSKDSTTVAVADLEDEQSFAATTDRSEKPGGRGRVIGRGGGEGEGEGGGEEGGGGGENPHDFLSEG